MAENSEDALPRCSTLFLTEDGSPMLFYMTPSTMKTRLRPLIHHGGGELSSKVLKESIKLVDPDESRGNLSGYVSSDYIFDSIKHNRLQDLEKYRLQPLDGNIKSSKSQKNPSTSTMKIPVSSVTGRLPYTNEEDLALLLFVNEHKAVHSVKGNALYKEAAKAKITSHTWQSMRDHYIKVLHKRKKPSDCEKLIAKSKKMPVVVIEKAVNSHAGQARTKRPQTSSPKKKSEEDFTPPGTERSTVTGQTRMTRAQTASPAAKKKIDCIRKVSSPSNREHKYTGQTRITRTETSSPKKKIDDIRNVSSPSNREQNAVCGQTRITRSQTASPAAKKKIDGIGNVSSPSIRKENTVADNLMDDVSADNADDVATDENVDYDKMFDDNLLRLAHESKVEKDHKEVDNSETEDEDVDEENKVSSIQEPDKRVLTRGMKRQMDEKEKLSDFDGKVSFRENLKRLSTDDEEDKRPIAKKSKRDLPCSSNGNEAHDAEDNSPTAEKSKNDLTSLSNGKEAQVKNSISHYQELQLSVKKLESQWTVPQIIHALLVNSGMLDDAENYLQHGTAGKEHWNSKEDKVLLSKNKEAIASLAKTRGLHSVANRMNFIEGIN